MSLESHYELGTDVALSILAVIITVVDNHSIHLHIIALYPHAAAYRGIICINASAHSIPPCCQRLECRLFLYLFVQNLLVTISVAFSRHHSTLHHLPPLRVNCM